MIREPDVINALAHALARLRAGGDCSPNEAHRQAAAGRMALTDLAEELSTYSDAPEHFLSQCGLRQLRCFACNKPVRTSAVRLADTRDDQIVEVGPDCFKRIHRAGQGGYQPRLGGPRLYPMAPSNESATGSASS